MTENASQVVGAIPGKHNHDECYYCGALVSRRSEGLGDHFPIPKRNGGNDIIPCCLSCHDMKDRFPLGDWPADWWDKVHKEIPSLSREMKIFLAKAFSLHSDKIAASKNGESEQRVA